MDEEDVAEQFLIFDTIGFWRQVIDLFEEGGCPVIYRMFNSISISPHEMPMAPLPQLQPAKICPNITTYP